MPPAVPLPSWDRPFYVGIDENGMGPRLGPLIVTSVLTEVSRAGAKVVTSRPRGAIAKRIGDSKKLLAFDDGALGEAWARAISRRSGVDPKTPAELLAALAIDPEEVLQAPCPGHHVDLCWSTDGEQFITGEAEVELLTKDLATLEARGVHVRRARVAIICTKRLNDAVLRGQSRFDVDLHTMERLTLDARDEAKDEVYALCGKVGGFDFYGPRFGPLGGYLRTMLVEGRARSEYHVPSVGRLAFLRDADDTHLLVGLASLVGKWARDHLMRRVVRYHRTHAPTQTLPDASGYHDPVTTRFIDATTLVRKTRNVETACFERNALGTLAATSSALLKRKEKAAKPKNPTPLALPGLREESSSSR